MPHRVLSVAGGLCAALFVLAAPVSPLGPSTSPALAQNADAKPADKKTPTGQQAPSAVDEYSAVQHAVAGAAGNPECVWLGRRVISLLWRDDIETAFRHLDLYDRFGCPAGHIQATFRCLILHSDSIDPKAPDSLNGRVEACWVNPTQPSPPASATSATAPNQTTNR